MHRIVFDWDHAAECKNPETVAGLIYQGLLRLAQIRQQNLAFTRTDTEIIDTGNNHVFGDLRQNEDQSILMLANFSEHEQTVEGKRLRLPGLRTILTDVVAGRTVVATQRLAMEPYQLMVLTGAK